MADSDGNAIDAGSVAGKLAKKPVTPEGWWDGSVGGLLAAWQRRALAAEARVAKLEAELSTLRTPPT